MLKKEVNYEFRKRMLSVHQKDRRDYSKIKADNELEIFDGMAVYIPKNSEPVLINAARDFSDYMFDSMGVSVIIKKGDKTNSESAIVIKLADECGYDLGDYATYRGYKLIVDNNGITIYANDYRGAQQALFYLEDLMNIRRAPYLKCGSESRKPMFSPQMVHSGYGDDLFPNEHLNAIAHEGRDSILIFVRGYNQTSFGFLDFNELIYRASLYGLDVYAYSYIKSKIHPCDEGAEAYYESTYGDLFKKCPGFKGLVLVGESAHFPSKDPNTTQEMVSADGIPTTEITSFYYPCYDYVDLVNMIKNVSRKYIPDLDVVFWSYNFSSAPIEARKKLIERLPEDISFQITLDKSEHYDLDGITELVADYSLTRAERSSIFDEEADIVKNTGMKLYAQANTAGRGWDYGVLPYHPAPYQWIKRFKSMLEAKEKYGLCGLMESHHYGIFPSFISKLSSWCFTATDNEKTMEEMLLEIISAEFGEENVEKVDEALHYLSESIDHHTATGEDQYGAFRCGPSYPFCLAMKMNVPSAPYAHMGNSIIVPEYCVEHYGRATLIGERIWKEIDALHISMDYLDKAKAVLNAIENKNDNLLYLDNMVNYMCCYVRTGISAKYWHTLKAKFDYYRTKEELEQVLNDMETLLLAEKKNAEEAIKYVELDSRLGWECAMEYVGDKASIEWKLRQLNYVLKKELVNYRKSLKMANGEYLV